MSVILGFYKKQTGPTSTPNSWLGAPISKGAISITGNLIVLRVRYSKTVLPHSLVCFCEMWKEKMASKIFLEVLKKNKNKEAQEKAWGNFSLQLQMWEMLVLQMWEQKFTQDMEVGLWSSCWPPRWPGLPDDPAWPPWKVNQGWEPYLEDWSEKNVPSCFSHHVWNSSKFLLQLAKLYPTFQLNFFATIYLAACS